MLPSPNINSRAILLLMMLCVLFQETNAQNNVNSLNAACGELTHTSVSFTWDKPAGVDSFHVYDLNNNDLLSKQTATEIEFTGINPGVQHELNIVPICIGGCPQMLSDTISCTSIPCPNISIRLSIKEIDNNAMTIVGNRIDYCLHNGSGVIDFDSTIYGIPTQPGRWETTGTGVIDQNGKFDVVASGQGSFQVRYVITENDNCEFRDLYTIVVENLPALDFTFDELICPNSPGIFSIPSYNDPRIVGRWIIEGGGVLEETATDTFSITWDQPGEYTVGMHIDKGINNCLSDTIWHEVVVSDKLSSTISCTPYNDKIIFEWTENSCYESYKILIDGVEVAEQLDPIYTVSDLEEGQEVNIEVMPSGSTCTCDIESAIENCTTTVCDPFTVEVVNETFLCDFQDAQLQLSTTPTSSTSQDTYDQVWTGPNVSESGIIDMLSLPNGESTFKLTTTIGQCNHDTIINIIKTSAPQFEIEYGGPACGGEKGFLDIFPVDYQEEYEIYIDDALVDLENRYSVDLSNHEVYITDSYGCFSDVRQFDLTEFQQVTASFDQRDDIIIEEEQEVDYNVILSNDNTQIDSIRWYFGDEMICTGGACDMHYSIAPEDSGSICAEIFFDASCTQMICASIRVNKRYDYYIPNIISLDTQTPENSSFTIFSEDESMLVNSFSIHDQWGNKVYEKDSVEKSKNITWSGDMNGQKVSSGIYAYAGELEFSNGRILKVNGDITVLGGSTN